VHPNTTLAWKSKYGIESSEIARGRACVAQGVLAALGGVLLLSEMARVAGQPQYSKRRAQPLEGSRERCFAVTVN
jgi:hypothetical protein